MERRFTWRIRRAAAGFLLSALLLPWPALADVVGTGGASFFDSSTGQSGPIGTNQGDLLFGPGTFITVFNGQIVVDNGSTFTAGGSTIGDTAAFTITGPQSRFEASGNFNRLDIQGPAGSLTIQNGGVVDATPGTCDPTLCNVFFGSFPGNDVTVVVDGAGSQLSTVNTLVVAGGNTDLSEGAGVSSTAKVDVTNGAVVSAETTVISPGLTGMFIQAGQLTDATLNVSGAGSQWNTLVFDVGGAFGDSALATVNVTAGGIINANSFTVGRSASSITSMTVDGAGSRIGVIGDLFLGVAGDAGLDVTGGGGVSAGNILVGGANGDTGTGDLTVDGTGSAATASQNLFVGDSGTGTLTVSNGAAVSAGADLSIGTTAIGSGSVAVTAGSRLDVAGTTFVGFGGGDGSLLLDQAGTVTANLLSVGVDNPSNPVAGTNGLVSVLNGSQLTVPGQLVIGSGAAATGAMTIQGTGSTVIAGQVFVGSNVNGSVGDGALGSLTVSDSAVLAFSDSFDIGFGAGSGSVSVDNGGAVVGSGSLHIGFDNPAAPNTGETLFGSLSLNGGGVQASDVTVGAMGRLSGSGFVAADVVNQGGTVDLTSDLGGEAMVVDGNYVQQGSALLLSVAGTAPGEFSQLQTTGDINLQGGEVDVSFVGGFTPQGGERLPMLIAQGSLNVDPSVAFNVGSGQTAFQLNFEDALVTDPSSGLQVPAKVGSFNLLEIDVADTGGLTPNLGSLARTFDQTCKLTEAATNLTADEQDLLSVCTDVRNAGNTPEQITGALQAMSTDETTQTTNALLLFTIPQHGNLAQRINGIRSGSNPFDFSGLNLMYDGNVIASKDLERMAKKLIGGMASADDFAKWGMFGNGNVNFGDQNSTANGQGFEYDTVDLTLGLDYRARDWLVFGGSVSYSSVNANFKEGGGLDVNSYALSVFSSLFREKYYLDLLATYGYNELETRRHIVFNTVMGPTNRRAKADTQGGQYSFSVGTGYDFTPGAWVIGPHGGANFTELEADAYREKGAGGLNLSVGKQAARSLTANLGFHLSYTFKPKWGVITPYLRADLVREFKDNADTITVHFVSDRFANDPTNQTPTIPVKTDQRDSYYQVYSVGASAQFIRGVAAFLNYRSTQSLADLRLDDVTWGLRLERSW